MDPKTQLIFEWIKMGGLLITAGGCVLRIANSEQQFDGTN